jgi:phage terminase small subunit
MAREGLTPKQARFVEEYLIDLNGAAAARRAGYAPKRADVIGYENLLKPEIQAAIHAALRERSARTGITADRVVQEIARLAFADPRLVMRWGPDGVELKPSDELTDEAAAMIAEVKESVSQAGSSMQVKFHSKVAALEQLAKHVGLYSGNGGEKTIVVCWEGEE